MGDAVFALVLWPIQALIQALYLVFLKVDGGGIGWTIVLISLSINSLLLPIYQVADRWQGEERQLQARMRPWIRDIRAVFRGDERHMILSTYHKQNGYHPLLSLRSSLGLLIQIPFFFAAYDFLAHAEFLRGQSFGPLADLSQPDALLTLAGMPIHVLPFVMTAVNLASTLLYSRNLLTKDKVQLFAMAALFLILLYSSPSGLVLYWTISNLFSLAKNAAHRSARPGRWFLGGALLVTAALSLPNTGLLGPLRPKYLVAGAAAVGVVAVLPWMAGVVLAWVGRSRVLEPRPSDLKIGMLAGVGLALLAGLVLPGLLIQSSPTEFGLPLANLVLAGLQAASLFVLLPWALRAVFNENLRRLWAPSLVFVLVAALMNAFLWPSAGAMNQNFHFTDPGELRTSMDLWRSLATILVALGAVTAFWRWGRRVWLGRGLVVLVLGLSAMAAITTFQTATLPERPSEVEARQVEPAFHLSRTQPNTILVFLDRAVGVAFPLVMERSPDLASHFQGFTYYHNTLSYGQGTSIGAPSLLGGYEYTPAGMAARSSETMLPKMNEALTLLARIHSQAGYSVTASNIPYGNLSAQVTDLSIYQGIDHFSGFNLKGKYRSLLAKDLGIATDEPSGPHRFTFDILVRFSLFRMAPPLIRLDLYRNGTWWLSRQTNADFDLIMDSYSTLHYLPALTRFDADRPSYVQIYNETTHENGAFGPDYRPNSWEIPVPVEDLRKVPTKEDALVVYNEGACLVALSRWFDQLRSEGVWDNTTIVVVADHGNVFQSGAFGQPGFERFNPLLLVKPAGTQGPLKVNEDLMTNADVPWLITRPLGTVVNPYTKRPILPNPKSEPITVRHHPTTTPDPHWIEVPTLEAWQLQGRSIFAPNAWKQVQP